MKSLLSEFDILMNVAGFKSVKAIDRTAIGKIGGGSRMNMATDSSSQNRTKRAIN